MGKREGKKEEGRRKRRSRVRERKHKKAKTREKRTTKDLLAVESMPSSGAVDPTHGPQEDYYRKPPNSNARATPSESLGPMAPNRSLHFRLQRTQCPLTTKKMQSLADKQYIAKQGSSDSL